MKAWGEVTLVVGTRDSVARCRTGRVGKASPVGGANGRAEIRLSPQVRHMVDFVEQRSSVPHMAGRRGQGSLRMVEMEEWDSRHWRMVEKAEQKDQDSGSRRMVAQTTQGFGRVRLEGDLVGSKFVVGPVGKWSEAGRMDERPVKGLKPRNMIDQITQGHELRRMGERDGYQAGGERWRALGVLPETALVAEGYVELDPIAVLVVVVENCIEYA